MIQGIDLFSGAGGMSAGAEMSGVNVRYAVENDTHAAATFTINHPKTQLYNSDIRSISGDNFKLKKHSPVVIFGGPPCQGFSTSNQTNRSKTNKNNWLYKEYVRLVSEVHPEWVVFENVKGLMETESGYFLDAVIEDFEGLGYSTSCFILNSADYGVPQTRNRLFIIANLSGVVFDAPKATTKRHVTVREAIEDLPDIENGNSIDVMNYKENPSSIYARKFRKRLVKCSNHLVTRNADHIIDRYRHIPQGGNWEDIPRKLMNNYTDVSRCHTGIYRRLDEDNPSVVIGNYRKNMLIHPWKHRGLSVREAARLQSFPDSFKFSGSIGFQQQQVGNAVPPLLAKKIFEKIVEA